MQDALQHRAVMANSEGNSQEKGPNEPDMSSLILVAGGRFEEEKMTSFRAAAFRKSFPTNLHHTAHDWNLKALIALG
jgi:hypothetical protein